jgi:exopolyphosphatase/pppGpp-phosphohydrolase
VIETVLDLCGATTAEVCQGGLREGIVLDHVRRVEEAGRTTPTGAGALAAEPAAPAAPAPGLLRTPTTAGSAS